MFKDRESIFTTLLLAGLAVLVLLSFLPLLDYFFAQDDFGLMYYAKHEPARLLNAAFGAAATYFRPLTRYVYFAVTYPVFGLNSTPYHVLSLLLHIFTALVVYVLLRRMRISAAPAAMATGFFALSVAYFHVIAWISCIQQVLAAPCFLLSFLFFIDAINSDSTKKSCLSVLFYALALLSIEQTLPAPGLMFLIAVFGIAGPRLTIGKTIKALWPHFLILGAYLAVRFLWKGIPQGGTLRFVFEGNVLSNLAVYLGAMYDFWPDVSDLIPNNPVKLIPPHLVLAAIVIYHLVRRRFLEVAFGLSFFLSTLLPLLFLHGHFFYYHTYIPALGTIYLLGLALGDIFGLLKRFRLHSPGRELIVVGVAILVVAAFSYQKVRANEKRALDRATWKQASFVLRRAQIAQTAFKDLKEKAGDLTGVSEIHLVYFVPGRRTIIGQNRDLYWALGAGDAVKLLFEDYDIRVIVENSTVGMNDWRTGKSRLFFYDDAGHCYTYDDIMRAEW